MSQTKAQLLDNIKDNVQLDARNSLRFADTDSSHYVAFKAPATVSSNVTWTLPAADGSANYVLATDGSGNLSWIADPAGQWTTSGSNIYFTGGNVGIGDSSPSNPLSVTGASSFNGDVTFTGASYNVVWDKSDNALEFADNAKAAFGTGSDFEIYHNGSNTHLRHVDSAPGDLYIDSYNASFVVRAGDGSSGVHTSIQCLNNAGVELYYDNSKKFETTTDGIKLSGNGYADFPDNGRIRMGADYDLAIYHDGSHSNINSSTGNLRLQTDAFRVNSQDNNESIIRADKDGAVELYYDNSKKLNTHTDGVEILGKLYMADSKNIELGSGQDLQLSHNGSLSLIQNATGNLYLDTTVTDGEIRFTSNSVNENMIRAVRDAQVELYYNGVKKLETTSTGISVTGSVIPTGNVNLGDSTNSNNNRFIAGASDDLQLYHDGSHSKLTSNNTGDLWLESINDDILLRAADNIFLEPKAGESGLKVLADGAVELYYNNFKSFQTNTSGITLYGPQNGDCVIDMYSDEGDDNADLWRQRAGQGGVFYLQNYAPGSWDTFYSAAANGGIGLYYDNSKKFETTSDGAKITATTGTGLEISQTHTAHGQGPAILINSNGAYNDGYIRYNLGNETSSWALGVDDSEDCFGLYFSGTTTTESPANAGRRIIAHESGSVELYHDNSKKFETTSDGVKLSGTGDVTFIINADTDNSGENDNPLLKFQQDGTVDCLGIGVIGDAGEYFTNSSQNSPYIAALGGHGGLGMEFATNGTRRMRINHGGTIDGDFNDTSDGNLKENIVSIGSSIDKVKTLRPVTFDWKDTTKAKNYSGFIAQEVKTVYPNLISGEEHTAEEPWKNYSLNTTGLVAYLTKALQEAITKIETLETKVAALESA